MGSRCSSSVSSHRNAVPPVLRDPELSLTEFRQLLETVVLLMINVRRRCTRFRDSILLIGVFGMSVIIIIIIITSLPCNRY